MDIKDKVILITGASGGIGKVLAEKLSSRGARLALLARRGDELNKLASNLSPAEVMVLPADVTEEKLVSDAVNQALAKYGSIDIVINNAGLGYFGPLESMAMEDFDRVVKTNLYGLLYVTQAAIPSLKQSKGMIVNISSGLSKRALPFLSAYAGSKSMVDAMSDGLRMELRKFGVKVLNYCPPEVDTDFHRNARKQANMQMGTNDRKMASADEVVNDIIKAIEKEKREVVSGKFLKIMNFFAPKMLDNIFYKAMVLKMQK